MVVFLFHFVFPFLMAGYGPNPPYPALSGLVESVYELLKDHSVC